MIPAAEADGDEGGARFDQPPGEQRALAPSFAAILVAEARVFAVDVERGSGPRAGNEIIGFLVEAVHRLHVAELVEMAALAVEGLRQRAPIFEPFERQALGEIKVLDAKVKLAGIAAGLERVVMGAEHMPAVIAGGQADAVDGRHADVGGHAAAARPDFA